MEERSANRDRPIVQNVALENSVCSIRLPKSVLPQAYQKGCEERRASLRILGLDVGTKNIGVALSDEMGWTAQALTTIERKGIQEDIDAIQRLVHAYEVKEVVVGLPITMEGQVGIQANKVIAFSQKLHEGLRIPVFHWDERLSTKAATKTLLEADMSRKKRKKIIDKIAAAFILQGYIDRKARYKTENREDENGST